MSVIVLIEDNLDNARLVNRLLGRQHQVFTATEGEAGLTEVYNKRPDLVLCDLGLPDVDGQSVIGMIRQSPSLSSTRVVAFTAYPEDVAHEIARVYGCDAVITKPIDTRSFVAQVNAILDVQHPA
jgi:CheY-like chemotaxis protein